MNDDDIKRQAELEQIEQVEAALFKKACEGNTTAIIFWLTNRSAARWGGRRHPHRSRQGAHKKNDPSNT